MDNGADENTRGPTDGEQRAMDFAARVDELRERRDATDATHTGTISFDDDVPLFGGQSFVTTRGAEELASMFGPHGRMEIPRLDIETGEGTLTIEADGDSLVITKDEPADRSLSDIEDELDEADVDVDAITDELDGDISTEDDREVCSHLYCDELASECEVH